MKLDFFIARRQVYDKKSKGISGSMVNIAIFGISLCIAVMLIAISIITGFKKEIRDKVIGFGSHIQIVNYDSNSSYETKPIAVDSNLVRDLCRIEGIGHVQTFGIKAGIIKTTTQIQGVVLKGVDKDFDWSFFKKNLISGNILQISDTAKTNDVLISRKVSDLLNLKQGDDFAMYFVQNPPRMRKFKVAGVYETGLDEFDKIYVLCDIGHIRKLNSWTNKQVSGYEIKVNDFDAIDYKAYEVSDAVGTGLTDDGSTFRIVTIKEKYPQIFDWLNLQDLNVLVILILMLIVAGFNMVSGLLILILDRTNMIGLLKAMGANNTFIRRVFLIESGFLTIKGLFWGNLIGLGLCLIQYYTHAIRLEETSYYMSYVPINLNIINILLLNVGAMVAIMLMLIIPSHIIARLNPVDSIRYN